MRAREILCLITVALLSASCVHTSVSPFEEELQRLDEVMSRSEDYVRAKEQKISTIENMLHSRGVSLHQQYHIYGELYKECQAFQFDKAKDALDSQISIAEKLGDVSLKQSAMLDKSLLLTTAGYYHEADRLFSQLDTSVFDQSQKIAWFTSRQKYLYDYQEYVQTAGFEVPDVDKVGYYQQQIVKRLPKESYFVRHIEVLSLFGACDYSKAAKANMELIASLDKDSRDYAVQTYWQGQICDRMGDTFSAVHWWVESSICDIRGAIKDNASLSTLATKLINPQDTDRAFKYIRFSLDDAAFYNAKLRKVQIATSFPMIEKAYTDSRISQEKDRKHFVLFIVCMSFLLAFISIICVSMYLRSRIAAREIREKNLQLTEYTLSIETVEDSLRKKNLELVEANAAKEEYLGLFLSMCSGYLDKLKKNIGRDQYEAELRNFYKTFDTSFLTLYPTFVEDFNELLKEEYRIIPKDGEMLNTELRIFALIKLGITQSSHIASLLRYSVNTIYNYRAQVKNAALEDRDNFEERVRKIGSKR